MEHLFCKIWSWLTDTNIGQMPVFQFFNFLIATAVVALIGHASSAWWQKRLLSARFFEYGFSKPRAYLHWDQSKQEPLWIIVTPKRSILIRKIDARFVQRTWRFGRFEDGEKSGMFVRKLLLPTLNLQNSSTNIQRGGVVIEFHQDQECTHGSTIRMEIRLEYTGPLECWYGYMSIRITVSNQGERYVRLPMAMHKLN
jgi:hypothetical protein